MEKDPKKEDSANARPDPTRPNPARPNPPRPLPPQAATTANPVIPVALDEKDKAILRLLQENGKMTVREVAAQVHLSTTPVHDRIKRMEDEGVIIRYAALVDHARVRKGLMAICYVSLKEHNKRSGARFIKAMHELPEVIECFIISGEFDFMLKVVADSMDAYYDFHVNKLGQVENIGQVQSTFVMGAVKQTFPQIG
ncbi:MAG: Lrp/AsnC family transcriptional regulator [Bacteroidota bacterium]|nr:Lrp/AsnC family transcriptional regulator [Bacteroidota bacterium]MDP4255927.1 Lrp/AsnC family transcriptional regulator [Bacteroidota bacterium]MDP4257326.1 Lrp/AsnC family transcriptional regulator [Bacteroidota bacterium]